MIGAQRLSASLRSALCLSLAASQCPRGAQRLSASLRSARGGRGRPAHSTVRCSTPFGITAVGTQLSGHVTQPSRSTCSTPFGITDVGTSADFRQHSDCTAVLNAFRHHCGRHTIGHWHEIGPRPKCSTPFGITAVGTSHGHRSCPACRRRCSTPFGITAVGTLRQSDSTGPCGDVLNAFRHHCGRHTDRRHRLTQVIARCSTPFGITAVVTAFPWNEAIATVDVLNAFRHHCGRHRMPCRRPIADLSRAQRLSASLRSAPSR